jgi:hypothetical protein
MPVLAHFTKDVAVAQEFDALEALQVVILQS